MVLDYRNPLIIIQKFFHFNPPLPENKHLKIPHQPFQIIGLRNFGLRGSVIFLLLLMGLRVSVSDTVGTIRALLGVLMPIFPILTSTFQDVIK